MMEIKFRQKEDDNYLNYKCFSIKDVDDVGEILAKMYQHEIGILINKIKKLENKNKALTK